MPYLQLLVDMWEATIRSGRRCVESMRSWSLWNISLTIIVCVATIAGLALTIVTLKFTVWTAWKDYQEWCLTQMHNDGSVSQACEEALKKPLPPPEFLPFIKRNALSPFIIDLKTHADAQSVDRRWILGATTGSSLFSSSIYVLTLSALLGGLILGTGIGSALTYMYSKRSGSFFPPSSTPSSRPSSYTRVIELGNQRSISPVKNKERQTEALRHQRTAAGVWEEPYKSYLLSSPAIKPNTSTSTAVEPSLPLGIPRHNSNLELWSSSKHDSFSTGIARLSYTTSDRPDSMILSRVQRPSSGGDIGSY